MAQLRDLAQSLPRPDCEWEAQPTFAPPTSPDQLAALEAEAGFPIPPDLREFFALTDRVVGMSVHNGYQIGGARLIAESLRIGSLPSKPPGTVMMPLTWDGGGNVFLLSADGDVWRWDHETGGTIRVADSFTAFLERVVADWAAYINDTPGWKFLV